jgi:hypothetical protein
LYIPTLIDRKPTTFSSVSNRVGWEAASAVGWYEIHEEEAAKRKKEGQVKGGIARHSKDEDSSLNLKSDSSRSDRDIKAMHANSAIGRTAAAAGVSRYKVEQATFRDISIFSLQAIRIDRNLD